MATAKDFKVAIIIDSWKLPIFKLHLEEAKIEFRALKWSGDTILLSVETSELKTLHTIVKAANDEAAKSKLQ